MTLDRYGHLFSEGLDHLADCRDRACAKASVYPACTDASAAGPGKAKGLVCDQALLVEVGRLELPSRGVVPGLLRAQPPGEVRTRVVRWQRSRVLASEGVPVAGAGDPLRVSLLSTPDPLPQAWSGGRLPK